MDMVCGKVAEAVNEAVDVLRPAHIRLATAKARGKIAYNYYAPDLYDRRISVIQALSPDNETIMTLVNLVNVGNAQILTIPGEALPNIGFYLKRKMRGKHNLLFGLTNDGLGYLLTKVDFASFDFAPSSADSLAEELRIPAPLNHQFLLVCSILSPFVLRSE
jgi:hypothetical protein